MAEHKERIARSWKRANQTRLDRSVEVVMRRMCRDSCPTFNPGFQEYGRSGTVRRKETLNLAQHQNESRHLDCYPNWAGTMPNSTGANEGNRARMRGKYHYWVKARRHQTVRRILIGSVRQSHFSSASFTQFPPVPIVRVQRNDCVNGRSCR